MRATHPRRITADVARAAFVVALAGCGGITTSGMDASGGHGGGGGANGVAGTTGTAGATGAAGTGGTTGTAGSDATGRGGTTGAAGSDGAGRGGTTGAAGNGVGGRGGTTGAAGSGSAGRGGTTGTAGSGSAGRGGTTGAAGTGNAGRGGTTGTAGSGNAGRGGAGGSGTGGTGVCSILCTVGRMCCGGACVNLDNDPLNCGKCGNICEGGMSFCNNGTCTVPPCQPNVFCIGTATCCGNMCCGVGQLCCEEQGPVSGGLPTCYTPTKDQPTCPAGCAPQCRSDRNQKRAIAPVDTKQILDKVARLPISTWTYIEEPDAVRHLGPMAQDFHASFGLGNDDKTYNSVDAHGVALAAIQALERMLAAQEKRIENLERENRRLERRLRAADSQRPAR